MSRFAAVPAAAAAAAAGGSGDGDWRQFFVRDQAYGEWNVWLDPKDNAREGFPSQPLTDESAARFAQWLRRHPPPADCYRATPNDRVRPTAVVNLSNNHSLGDRGLDAIVGALLEIRLDIRLLKVYKCNIGRAGEHTEI